MAIALLGLGLGTAPLFGQGTITFANSTGTLIINGFTGAPAQSSLGIKVGLYYAQAGEENEANFTLVAVTPMLNNGLFIGGGPAIPGIPPGEPARFQVKAWEAAYGATYEEALAAPRMNRRGALLGKSLFLQVPELGGGPFPSPTLVAAAGFRGFTIYADIEPPVISINDLVVSEGTNGTRLAVFTITFSEPATEPLSLDFTTVDGSALAGQDYEAANGTLIIPAGTTNHSLGVVLTADQPHEPDESFQVRLSNASAGYLLKGTGQCLITEAFISSIQFRTRLSFNTLNLRPYRIESSLDETQWLPVTNVLGNGGLLTVLLPDTGCTSQRIYRAVPVK